MKSGLYEQIVNKYLLKKLEVVDDRQTYLMSLDSSDSNAYLAQYLYRVMSQGLSELTNDKNGKRLFAYNHV